MRYRSAGGSITIIVRVLTILGLLIGLGRSAQGALVFYGVSQRGGYLYEITYDPDATGEKVSSSFVRRLDTNYYGYYYGALDYGADGNLYTIRGTGGSGSLDYGQLYRLAPSTFNPSAVSLGTNRLSGMGSATQAGLAFLDDGTFYTGTGLRYASGANRKSLYHLNTPFTSAMDWFYDPRTSYTAPYLQGLQWYDETLWALTADTTTGTLHLYPLTHGASAGTYGIGEAYDAGGWLGTATHTAIGDLALIEDMMFAAVWGKLYSYDMSMGPGQEWQYLGDLPMAPDYYQSTYPYGYRPNYLSGLAAVPGQALPAPDPIPEPASLLVWLGVIGACVVGARRRLRASG